MFESKKTKALKALLKEAYEHLRNYEFDKAITLYNKINGKFELLPKIEKTEKLKTSVDNLNKGLILYLKISEASALIEEKDLSKLKDLINQLSDMINGVSIIPDLYILINYAKKHYKFYLDVYNSKYYENKFEDKFYEIVTLIKYKKISEATKQYYILLNYYKELIKYKDVSEVRPRLDFLLQEIDINKLVKAAYEKVESKKVIKPIMQEEEPYIQKIKPKTTKVIKFDPIFDEIHNLIKNNKYEEASVKFNNV